MTIFKPGDVVRRKKKFLNSPWWRKYCGDYSLTLSANFVVKSCSFGKLMLFGAERLASADCFEFANPKEVNLEDYL